MVQKSLGFCDVNLQSQLVFAVFLVRTLHGCVKGAKSRSFTEISSATYFCQVCFLCYNGMRDNNGVVGKALVWVNGGSAVVIILNCFP